MKIDLNQTVTSKPAGYSELPVREKLMEISVLITTLNIMFREVREQIEKNERSNNS